MKKYVEVPKTDLKHKVENVWFEKCRENKIPFITVKCRTKFADVHWDYITYPGEMDSIFIGLDGKLRDGAIAIFMKYANKQSKYDASDLLVWFKDVEISKAKMAAEELYDLVMSFVDVSKAHKHA